ncbi:MAG: TraB/GumN family protein [Pseudomonadota bacterium]
MKKNFASTAVGLTRDLRAVLAAFALVTLTACYSQVDEPDDGTNPLLYEITAPDGSVEGWMLGTIHALPDGVGWRTDKIESAIAGADMLLVEIADLEDRDAIADVFAELGTTHGLPPLLQRVPPSERPALRDLMEDAGADPSNFSAIETWAAALMLTRAGSLGSAENGVDLVLAREFKDRDILEFEGAAAQLTVFDELAEEDQRVLLSAVVQDVETHEEDSAALLSAWLSGDEEALESFTTTGAMADKEVRDALLVNRNRAWLGKLAGLLKGEEKPLVAVGAAHLVGPDGLPKMLEARGYTVRRVE